MHFLNGILPVIKLCFSKDKLVNTKSNLHKLPHLSRILRSTALKLKNCKILIKDQTLTIKELKEILKDKKVR